MKEIKKRINKQVNKIVKDKELEKKSSKENLPLFFLLFLLFPSLGCGIDLSQEGTTQQENMSFSKEALSGGKSLEESEVAIALRICYAFRSKRSQFKAEFLGKSFDYSYLYRDCEDKEETDSFSATLSQNSSDGALLFNSSFSGNYRRDVQTDTHGLLKEICTDVLSGETPLNSKEIENELYEYDFRHLESSKDRAILKIGHKESTQSEEPRVFKKVIFDILTGSTMESTVKGMVIKSKVYLRCENSSSLKLYQQTLK